MARIHKLNDELINQIAAGEVVERPASVVKELAENSVDAGATRIVVQLTEGGLNSICVSDNGSGMSPEDALTCLERHATSKLIDAEGLFSISTKGFRGEAIPSMASISRFTLETAEHASPQGTRVTVEGGSKPQLETCAARVGTRIEIQDLFFNTPARRKFLKREATELSHCEEAVVRLALAHPEVGFALSHGEKVLLQTVPRPKSLALRIADVLGLEIEPHLLPIEELRLGLKVSGFVASPEFTLSNARGFYLFVNRRYIRDRGLNAAIARAFQDALPPGRQPVFVINIELDPATVDVNVHPQKLEVRFCDPRGVQEALGQAIKTALRNAPWRKEAEASKALVNESYALAVDRFLTQSIAQSSQGSGPVPTFLVRDELRPGFGTAKPSLNEAPPPDYFGRLRFLGAFAQTFWVLESPAGTLVIVDQRAAFERIYITEFSGELLQSARQSSVFSKNLKLELGLVARLLKQQNRMAQLGIEIEPFGPQALVLSAVPSSVALAHPESLLMRVLEALESSETLEGALIALASAAAALQPKDLSAGQVHAVLQRLDAADFSLPVERAKVVVQELHALELKAKNG
jgi:DNA mismatch repair protein MutL